MEKRLTTFFMFAALLFAPFALVGCGEDIQVPDNPNNEEIENPLNGAATIFTGSKTALDGDGTRTSMDANRKFYWEAGDYIWVDTLKNGTFTGKSHSIELSNPTKAPSATFYYRQIILTEQNYNLTYTGNNSSSGTEVTIAAAQEQEGWNNAAHLGKSGDCGFATTEDRDTNGKYKFVLKHQAAYLVFQPYRATAITDGWKLKSIEIISDNAIAGIYDFGMSGIVTSPARNTANSIKLTCKATQSSDFTIPQTTPSADNSCYVVIQPGTHKLTIRYEIQPTGSVNGVAGGTFFITEEFASRNYKVNGVSTIKHELDLNATYSPMRYYLWDTVNPYWHGVANADIPKANGATGTGYGASEGSSANAPVEASNSCKDLPNVNEMSWYAMAGDPRWENDYPWYFEGSDGSHIFTQGAWFLKSGNITGFRADKSYDNTTDLRTTAKVIYTSSNVGIQYKNTAASFFNGGRPAGTELDKYFFLPALGHVDQGTLYCPYGMYWSSSAAPVPPYNGASYGGAYVLGFQNRSDYGAYVMPTTRGRARAVAPDWFQ